MVQYCQHFIRKRIKFNSLRRHFLHNLVYDRLVPQVTVFVNHCAANLSSTYISRVILIHTNFLPIFDSDRKVLIRTRPSRNKTKFCIWPLSPYCRSIFARILYRISKCVKVNLPYNHKVLIQFFHQMRIHFINVIYMYQEGEKETSTLKIFNKSAQVFNILKYIAVI